MKTLLLLILTLVLFQSHGQKFTISGSIRDKASGENLIGSTVFNSRTLQGTTTNTYGFYSITLPQDSVALRFSYVGYEAGSLEFFLSKDTTINIELASAAQLDEVVIRGTPDDRIQERTVMSTIDVPIEQIKSLPALMGEVDVLKVLQLLPGVQAGSEGSSGLYVRGGGADQNLILLDGVPLYNASHLFGFFSVFNADAINHVELIKGGFPARYGGRLSSVINVAMKEGDDKKFRAEGSIGLIASRLTVEGPIIKDRTSFIFSGRRTYIDVLASPLIKNLTNGEEQAGYYFYDLNGKVNHRINKSNRLFLSAYTGDDKAYARSKYSYTLASRSSESRDNIGLGWGNLITALRWNSILSNKLFSNVTATYSRYRFYVSANSRESITDFDTTRTTFYHTEYNSGIRDFGIKADFDYIPSPKHYVKFGGQAIHHRFTPGVLSYRATEIADTTLGAQVTKAVEFFAYVEDDFLITEKLKVNAGLHLSGFSVENKFYSSVQPRLSARYLISPSLSWKVAYAQMTQYIHLLSNVGIGLPTDLWVPATAKIGPEQAFQSSSGLAYHWNDNFEISIEGYYKKMTGLVEYKEGANYLNIESDWQTKVETGTGNSYGGEFFIQKKKGKVSGWIGYTLSWTNRTFPNINGGKTFPYRYDRRHDLKTAVVYKWKDGKDFSFTWVYGSGAAVTLPQSSYSQSSFDQHPFHRGDQSIQYYGDRNSFRMRAYHRLDLNYTTTKKTKWGERSWSIGVYNAYSRRNPFFIDLTYDKAGSKKFVQYSLFPIIPSIAYRFKF